MDITKKIKLITIAMLALAYSPAVSNAQEQQEQNVSNSADSQNKTKQPISEMIRDYYKKQLSNLDAKNLSREESLDAGLKIYNQIINQTYQSIFSAPNAELWQRTADDSVSPLFKVSISPINRKKDFNLAVKEAEENYPVFDAGRKKIKDLRLRAFFDLQYGFNHPTVVLHELLDAVVACYASQEKIDIQTNKIREIIIAEHNEAATLLYSDPNNKPAKAWRTAAENARNAFMGKMLTQAIEQSTNADKSKVTATIYYRSAVNEQILPQTTGTKPAAKKEQTTATKTDKDEKQSVQEKKTLSPSRLLKFKLLNKIAEIEKSDDLDIEKIQMYLSVSKEVRYHESSFRYAPDFIYWNKTVKKEVAPLFKISPHEASKQEFKRIYETSKNLFNDLEFATGKAKPEPEYTVDMIKRLPHLLQISINNLCDQMDKFDSLAAENDKLKRLICSERKAANNPSGHNKKWVLAADNAVNNFVNVRIVTIQDIREYRVKNIVIGDRRNILNNTEKAHTY